MNFAFAKRKFVYLAAVLALACVGSATTFARAGLRSNMSVLVNTSGGGFGGPFTASGALGTAHNSAGANEYIGCYASANAQDIAVHCEARNSTGTFVQCTTYGARNLFDAVNGINGDSYIVVTGDSTGGGTCTGIDVYHYSSNYNKAVPGFN